MPSTAPQMPTPVDLLAVSPALADVTEHRLEEEVWQRPGLSPRDRSLVTIAALVSRGQTAALDAQLEAGLQNGLKPSEVSELVLHLAFYAGWGQVMASVPVVQAVFARHGIQPQDLPPVAGERLPLNEAAEAQRARAVQDSAGAVAPGVVHYTGELLFKDLWLRPALAPRDRSLVTVAALIANGQVAQVTYHLNRAMDNGLTREEAGETLTQLAFYAGWPNVFSAIPVVKAVFEAR